MMLMQMCLMRAQSTNESVHLCSSWQKYVGLCVFVGIIVVLCYCLCVLLLCFHGVSVSLYVEEEARVGCEW